MTEELKKQMNLDWCSNETIQTLCTQLGHAYAQSLVSHLSDGEPRPTASSLGQAPVLIEEDNEEEQEEGTSCDTAAENNNEIEEYNRSMDQDATQSPAKRARII